MLYVHGGWPRTGTTSFQATLYRWRDRLAEAGVLYPDILPEGNDRHNGFVGLFDPVVDESSIGSFHDFLRAHADRSILLSTEILNAHLVEKKRAPLLSLLSTTSRVMPITGLWTLRRMDAMLTSSLLRQLWRDDFAFSHAEFLQYHIPLLTEWFAGLLAVERETEGRISFSRYDPGGGHHDELLRATGLRDPVRRGIVDDLRRGPRRNMRPTRKVMIVLMHLDAVSARAEVDVSLDVLREGFIQGDFWFDDDTPCELVDYALRRTAHERALDAAAKTGFEPYLEFYGEDKVPKASPASLDPDALTDDDLARLATYMRRAAP